MGRQPNTVQSNLISKILDVSEIDSQLLDIQPSNFQDDLDFKVLLRDRSRGSKLESAFSKNTGGIVKETNNTITMLPEKSAKEKTYSNRDIAKLTRLQKRAWVESESSGSSTTPQEVTRKPKGKRRKTEKGSEFLEIAIELTDEAPKKNHYRVKQRKQREK